MIISQQNNILYSIRCVIWVYKSLYQIKFHKKLLKILFMLTPNINGYAKSNKFALLSLHCTFICLMYLSHNWKWSKHYVCSQFHHGLKLNRDLMLFTSLDAITSVSELDYLYFSSVNMLRIVLDVSGKLFEK